MWAAFSNLFRVETIRKKIVITLSLLLVYILGSNIPLPGVDYALLREYILKSRDQGVSQFVGLMNALTGANLNAPVVMSLGILPYITASIIISLLVKVVPSLEALSKEGPSGQAKINRLSRYLTVPICVAQGTAIVLTYFRPEVLGGQDSAVIPGWGLWFVISAVVSITAGTVFLMWIGEQITAHGIGNGTSLLITAGILSDIPQAFLAMFQRAAEERAYILTAAALLGLYLAVVIAVVYQTKAQRRIPIQQAKLQRGHRMVGGAKHYLPIKLNMASVMPVIFAQALLTLPATLGQAIAGSPQGFLPYGGWWWVTIETGLIFFFAFFWTSLMFQPNEMANNLKEYGSFIPGIRPGRKTAEFLERVMMRVTLVGAAFLSAIVFVPTVVSRTLEVDMLVARFLGGTGILIVVGVTLELVEQLNSSLLQRNYEGFMSAAAARRGLRR
jgi:preprotein translocase subunit SecY